MISLQVQAAVTTLQQRASKAHDVFELERIDRALDELNRNPLKTTADRRQVRSAMRNAGKVLAHRKLLLPLGSTDDPRLYESVRERALGCREVGYDVVDLLQWLDTTPALTTRERWLLRALAGGADAEMLADMMGVPVVRVRERIARARRAAAGAYEREVRSA